MDELVDEIIEILNDDDLREIFLGYLIQRRFSKIITQDEIYFGIYHVKPEVYEKLEKNDDKKQIILKAISLENKGKRRLAEILFYNNPLAFLSKEEIEKILVPEKIKELGWSTKIVESFIKATGNIEKYLDSETIDEYELESVNIERLIIATGNIEKYLTPDELDRLRLLNSSRARLIEATGNIEKYLRPEIITDIDSFGDYWEEDHGNVATLIEETGNIEKYLTHDLIRAFELRDDPLSTLIEETGNIEKYLIPEIIEYLDVNNLERLIIATGNVDKYLKPEFIKASTFGTLLVKDLIFESKHPEIYLTGELIDQFELDKNTVVELIKKTRNIGEYLTREKIRELKLSSYDVIDLIESTRKIGKYLTPEIIRECKLDSNQITRLIKKTGEIDKYLTGETIKAFGLDSSDVCTLIRQQGNIEKYLTPEIIKEFGLDHSSVRILISQIRNVEKYLTPEIIKAFGLNSSDVCTLIQQQGNIEKYLTPETIKSFGLNSLDVTRLILKVENRQKYLTNEMVHSIGIRGVTISSLVLGRYEIGFAQLIDEEIDNGTYDYNKIVRLGEIINDFQDSNSGRISKIATELAIQIYALNEKEQEDAIKVIKNIYLTTNLPTFAQNFLVFKQLHPKLLEENKNQLYEDKSEGNIPSLSQANSFKRNCIIFSDLLGIAVESNNRNLRDYLYIIEQGDKLFNLFKKGQLKVDDELPEKSKEILQKYSEILNSLYNQTSKGKRSGKARVNSGNLEQDLQELDTLFSKDTKIKRSLPDRIVRMFGYWAGIRSFEQAKKLIEEKVTEADKKNRLFAKNGKFTVQKGDFVKGIKNTEYFPSMLQNGLVAKDYLGQNSTSDSTPLDMDVELIREEGNIQTATSYVDGDLNGRKLGSIIIVIKNDGNYVKTRVGTKVDEEAVKTVIQDRSKKEYFDNNGIGGENSYGIRTGIGSTNISYIIADRYVDKLGLEIAINGFYIPVVNQNGILLFTPEMYDELRSKMQGMSYYGVSEFKLDESAKNAGTKKLIGLIEENKEKVNNKREKILQTLREAIEKFGLTMSDKRRLDLLEGIVEVIDTGSTGRGTNEPGDGDFDFIIRLDSKLLRNPKQIKEEIQKVLYSISKPDEGVTTAKGDFRFKGVSIKGLEDKVDLDLTFIRRTDEIEYTTEECIIDRLETIKRNNPEDYKYVVANILLAKKVLKTEGAYKKKSAPSPEDGKKDIRGGLGAVGIENWVLQNGGSFEKAAKGFLETAQKCNSFEEFQQRYAVWDFGENYMAGQYYPHDNFVYNMNEDGYRKMKKALEDYIKAISTERENSSQKDNDEKGLEEIVKEDMSILNDTIYVISVENLLAKARRTNCRKIKYFNNISGGKYKMENIEFNNACLEVLEILRHVKKTDLLKIPKEEIQVLRKNANYNHKFVYNPEKDIKEQEVSKLAKGIIAVYFYKYTASEQQREKIKLKQKSDLNKIEQEKKELYKNEDIFKNKTEIKLENEDKNTQLIEYKNEKWYRKLFKKLKWLCYNIKNKGGNKS